MVLKTLRLSHFRNLGVQKLAFPPLGVAVIGDNAQGKTNLLEAVYYLETFRSFRGARDDQLLAFDEEVFRVEAGLVAEDGTGRRLAAAYERRGKRKKVTVDGAEPNRIGEALGLVGAVVFSPSDVTIVSEGPGERRRFLDIVLSLATPGYLAQLQRFRHVLAQRNAALRDQAPRAAVQAWDDGLVRSGAAVAQARRAWIDARGEAFSSYYRAVSGGAEAHMGYAPNVVLNGAVSQADAAAAYREALASSTDRERRMGSTVVGPHRDDVVLSLEAAASGASRPLQVRDYGSGGQRRTAALALRLVEAATVREATGEEPIILMDDVFAELDEGRSARVMDLIEREETGQVILTAPKESDVRIRRDTLPRWTIENGRIRS